jgi:aspartokinase
MKHLVGVATEIVEQVHAAGANIEMLSQSNSELNVSVVVNEDDSDAVVGYLHSHFIKRNSVFKD